MLTFLYCFALLDLLRILYRLQSTHILIIAQALRILLRLSVREIVVAAQCLLRFPLEKIETFFSESLPLGGYVGARAVNQAEGIASVPDLW